MHSPQVAAVVEGVDPIESLYWLAGLLEGEGSFLKGPPSSPRCPIVHLPMTDQDVVERAARLFGRSVTPWDRRSTPPRRRVFFTRVKGAPAAMVMRRLHPLMGSRRQAQIDVALAASHAERMRAAAMPSDVLDMAEAPLLAPVPDSPRAIAWLAGLLEGEGSFMTSVGYPEISVTMCDRDVLERAANVMGIPKVSPRDVARNEERGWSAAFEIDVSGSRAAEWMRRLRPWMGHRRTAAIDRALAAYHPVRLTEPPRTCVVSNCDAPHRSRGLCHKHYMTWTRDRKRERTPRITPLR